MFTVLFTAQRRINFGDADPLGILYYPRVFQMAHECLEAFWDSQSRGWGEWFQNREFAIPIKAASVEFFKPLHVGQTFQVEMVIDKLGSSSVTFTFNFKIHDQMHAQVHSTHVFVSKKDFTKIAIPSEIREILA